MLNNKELAKLILKNLGGKDNITNAVHCVTRLRVNLVDVSKADLKAIENIEGILGVQFNNGQHQIIIGPKVADIFIEFAPMLNENFNEENVKTKISVKVVFDVITGIFSPIIPALVAGGILKGILAIIAGFGIDTGVGTYTILSDLSDVPFYFLPFLLAISSARKFKVNEFLAVCVAGMLMYPTFIAAIDSGTTPYTVFGMVVPVFKYADSVFPIIFGVGILSIVYRFIDKFIPDLFKLVVVPALSLMITVPLTMLFFAPLGAYGGLGLAEGIVWLFTNFGPLAGFLLGFFMPLIVVCGMHQSTSPIQISNIATLGYDYLLPISFCHNMAESGAAFGAALRMKNKKMKSAAITTSFSAFMGISEPALFTVNVVNKTPLIAAMIANGIGGGLTTLFAVKCFGFVMPGITSLPVYANPDGTIMNLLLIVLCIIVTFVIAAILSFILSKKTISGNSKVIEVMKPVEGEVIEIEKVNDKVFSTKMMGEGYAVIPKSNRFVAPVDGTVSIITNTKHAHGITAPNGAEVLVHIGLNTVELNGDGFISKVKIGDVVKAGQVIIEADLDKIKAKGCDVTTIVVCTNSKEKHVIVAANKMEID